MALSAGNRLGQYEIVAAIGAGGMGEVYRARDTRLNRQVAIKVLPAQFAADPDRVARFEREAQAVAALSHPGILAIHDFGSGDGIVYAVMELLEGETLRTRLSSGALPVRRALAYALQIAQALAAAHDRGIAHRDLKPENLFVTSSEQVKILDFGLARQVVPAAVGDATYSQIPARHTEPGTVMGTVGYMAPEQVRGEPGDARSDLFSFGAVLFEMVTGRRAFDRETAAETMTAILREDPLEHDGAAVPESVGRLIAHCLEKKPEARFRTAHDLAFALETVAGTSSSRTLSGQAPLKAQPTATWMPRFAAVALVVALLSVPAAYWVGSRARPSSDVAAHPQFRAVTFESGVISRARFTPDGRTIVYSAQWGDDVSRLFMSRVERVGSTRLSLPQATVLLAVSPTADLAVNLGRTQVTRNIAGTMAQVPMLGGTPRPIAEDITFADWSASGMLAVVRLVGDRQRLEAPPGTVLYETSGEIGSPRFSRNGDRIAFLDWPVKDDDRGQASIIDLKGNRRAVTGTFEAIRSLAWSPDGNEIWYSASQSGPLYSLRASSLDGRERLLFRGPDGLLIHDVTADGHALVTSFNRTTRAGVLLEGDAGERDLSIYDYAFIRDISIDGRFVLFSHSGGGSSSNYDVYIREVSGADPTRVGEGQAQQFSPDGQFVLAVVHGPPAKVMILPAGVGQPREVATGKVTVTQARFVGDGRELMVIGTEEGHRSRAYVVSAAGGAPRPISPEGISVDPNAIAVAADGSRVVLRSPEGRVMLYPLQSGDAVPVRGLAANEMPTGWTADSLALLLVAADDPSRIDRLDPVSGRRETWLRVRAKDTASVPQRMTIALGRNRKSYAANYQQTQMTLYVVDGLR